MGHDPEKLYHSCLTFENEQRIGALVKGQKYFVRVDAFNENGITEGRIGGGGKSAHSAAAGYRERLGDELELLYGNHRKLYDMKVENGWNSNDRQMVGKFRGNFHIFGGKYG